MVSLKGNLNLQALGGVAVVFLVFIIALSMGSTILTDLGTQNCEGEGYTWSNDACWSTYNTTAGCPTGSNCVEWNDQVYNVTQDGGQEALENMSGWAPTLATVVIAAVIIGILSIYLMGRRR